MIVRVAALPCSALKTESTVCRSSTTTSCGAPTKVVYGDQMLLEELTAFIKQEVVAFYTYHPEFERFTGYKSNWKTTTFKKVCAGLGYRINPDREGNRWLKSVNGENKDFYQVVPQEGASRCPEY